jgi:hypothetical protein
MLLPDRQLLNTPVDLATHRKCLSGSSAFVPNIARSITLIGKVLPEAGVLEKISLAGLAKLSRFGHSRLPWTRNPR